MKQLKYISTIILAVMFATLLGCASTSKQEGTGECCKLPRQHLRVRLHQRRHPLSLK